jgi:hypothetical protein
MPLAVNGSAVGQMDAQSTHPPHWYTVETLRALLAAYVVEDRTAGRTRSVREFVAEFAGLKGTRKQKAVTEAAALGVKTIAGLVESGDIAEEPCRHS